MSAASERFALDTNLHVYAIDSASGIRHQLAREIVQRAARLDCWVMLQAVSEFYAAVSRQGIVPPFDASAQAADWLELFRCAAASETAVRTALADTAAGRASYWDALLVATAAEAGCHSERRPYGWREVGRGPHSQPFRRGGRVDRSGSPIARVMIRIGVDVGGRRDWRNTIGTGSAARLLYPVSKQHA
jgi:predicted nucleic acid-binding protein